MASDAVVQEHHSRFIQGKARVNLGEWYWSARRPASAVGCLRDEWDSVRSAAGTHLTGILSSARLALAEVETAVSLADTAHTSTFCR